MKHMPTTKYLQNQCWTNNEFLAFAILERYHSSKDLTHWDKIINSYNALQEIYFAIIENDPTSALVKPDNY